MSYDAAAVCLETLFAYVLLGLPKDGCQVTIVTICWHSVLFSPFALSGVNVTV